MTAVTTIPAPADAKRPAIVRLLTEPTAAALLTPLLPAGITLDRVASEVFFAARKEPKLLQCTPDTVLRAVATALQRGLVIGETIHLVPVGDACQPWNDYKGDVELVIRTGVCQAIMANPVYEREEFAYEEGLEPFLRHVPARRATDRGALIGAYARARVRAGHYVVRWMPLDDVEAIRAKSKSWGPARMKECPPWYAMKTAVHALCKLLPKNPRFRALVAQMDEEREAVDVPVEASDPSPALEAASNAAIAARCPECGEGATGEDAGEYLCVNGHVWAVHRG